MKRKAKLQFDPQMFLAKVSEGKSISKYSKNQTIFSQGQIADAVFYIQKGKVKLTVVSEQGKEAVVAFLGPGHFFWRRMSERPSVTRRNDESDGRMRDYSPGKGDHDRDHS